MDDNTKQAQQAITEFLNKMTELKRPAFVCVLGEDLYLESSNLDINSKYLFSLTTMFEAACATMTETFEEAQERLQVSSAKNSWTSTSLVEQEKTSPEDPDILGDHLVATKEDEHGNT